MLPPEIRARVLERVIWRLTHMSDIAPGPPEGAAAHSTLTIDFGTPPRPAITFHASFVRTTGGASVLLLGVSEPRGRSDPRQLQLDELVAAGTAHNGSGRERETDSAFSSVRSLSTRRTPPAFQADWSMF